jgi:hypothetical protein
MGALRWSEGDLDERIGDDCVECLANAKQMQCESNLDRLSAELIERNP